MQDVLSSLFQHAAMTAGVTVRVAVNFMPDQSRTEAKRWFWVYHIRIENHREDTVRLLTRHWRITDSRGMVSLVDGEGVVGETPVLAPGGTHDYVSGCELVTNMGEEAREEMGVDQGMLRINVGLEHPADLIADLDQAFGEAGL